MGPLDKLSRDRLQETRIACHSPSRQHLAARDPDRPGAMIGEGRKRAKVAVEFK